ncbi:MAG: hypothetical protein KKE91_04130, partial [Candidatus Omnitrophica bacterium]|nr:hypothetical protein [Candidatus Omnitrophota bacterium]
MNPYSLSSLIASSACFFFAIPVILKGARNSQNRSFFLATVFTGIWTLFPFLTSLPKSDYNALLIARLLYIFAVFVPTAWFYFMISLLGKTEEKKKLIVFYIVSILFAAVSFTPLLVKDVRRFAPSFSPEPGPLYFPFMIFFAVIFTNIFFKL